jgi:CheY-like chemotaxis protein
LGFQSIAVGSGEEAVDAVNGEFQMIFMDIGLPGITGEHAALLIREKELQKRLPRVPIVALTAYASHKNFTLAGMDDHLQKPAMLADIERMVQKWARKNGNKSTSLDI